MELSASQLFQLVKEDIQLGSGDKLKSHLEMLHAEIDSMQADIFYGTVLELSNYAAQYNQSDMIKVLLDFFNDYEYAGDRYPLSYRIYTLPGLKEKTSMLIGKAYVTHSGLEILNTMIDHENSESFRLAMNRLRDVYNITAREMEDLWSKAKTKQQAGGDTEVAQDVLEDNYEDVAPYAEVPDWVEQMIEEWNEPGTTADDMDEYNLDMPEPDNRKFLQNYKRLVEFLPDIISGITINGTQIDLASVGSDRVSLIMNAFFSMGSKEQDEFLRNIAINIGLTGIPDREDYDDSSLEIFNLFGPANVIVGMNLDRKDRCAVYGGCRMLICNCHAKYNDEDNVYEDDGHGFKGNCAYCKRKIRVRWHGIRIPLLTGGWSEEWFCSDDCLYDLIAERGADAVGTTNELVDVIVDQLQKKKIQDRTSQYPTKFFKLPWEPEIKRWVMPKEGDPEAVLPVLDPKFAVLF
ncbi:Hypothetical protein ORPV_12 [Orpheovirus IHUMI-LCC2]|uniref:Uncharacterized protein n=1 Tax=Orpheovirus IHUMI-LCC2 TaxID=2023057 RepID=A0A2I2L313_9VIRU|nr:Hypothetical protein ORPV_12 [Orpheovirus IHUMI-LCC2]SNW61916.1 Hypothetical protein ORPV_12 [Orpheovirus IHUMI-LCC2]